MLQPTEDGLFFLDRRQHQQGPVAWLARHAVSQPTSIPPHCMEQWQLLVVVKGSCRLRHDGQSRCVDGGHRLLLPVGTALESPPQAIRGLVYWIGLRPDSDHDWAWLQAQRDRILAAGAELLHRVADLWQLAASQSTASGIQDAAWEWDWLGASYRCLAAILREPERPTHHDGDLQAALDLLAADLTQGMPDIRHLAAACGWSVATFRRRFLATMGQSPLNWRQMRQLAGARAAWIAREHRDLESLATSSGFSSRRQLVTVARRLLGEHPEDW